MITSIFAVIPIGKFQNQNWALLNKEGEILGFTIGPAIRLSETVDDLHLFEIICRIYRNDQIVLEGSANTRQLKRGYEELISSLKRDNLIFEGTVLLTGTCIVPPNDFTLEEVIELR